MGNTLKDLKAFARENSWGDDIILQLNEFSEKDKSVRNVLRTDASAEEKICILLGID